MWENRPAVPGVFSAPCQNCKNRKIPKTCEDTCELWIEYKKKKEKADAEVKKKRNIKSMFIDMYNDARQKREKNDKR